MEIYGQGLVSYPQFVRHLTPVGIVVVKANCLECRKRLLRTKRSNPDQLLAQILAAATYPLEIVEASHWLKNNSSLKGEALVQEAAKQDWEPGVQALVMFPSVLDQMDRNLQWTTSLGNAFLAQQEEVMFAVNACGRRPKPPAPSDPTRARKWRYNRSREPAP